MKFSVLMSVYYKENPNYLKACLDSIINQTIKPDEIVIVKDGKLTYDLENIISLYTDKYKELFNILTFEENKGLGHALKEGVKQCKYDIIARMDTDDICRKDRFEKQLDILKNKDVDIVGSYIDEYDEDMNKKIAIRKVPINHIDILKYLKKRNPFNHMTVMYKKNAILDAGNYIEFHLNEDYYLWARLLNKGYNGYNVPESLVYARTGDSMFERRGGVKYAKMDIKLQKEFYRIGLVNELEFLINILTRVTARLIPNYLRKQLYCNLLRK